MRYIVCYDIENDKLRREVAQLLCTVGLRMQFSVFVVNTNKAGIKKLQDELTTIIKSENNGDIFICPIDEVCWQKSWCVGNKTKNMNYFVI